MSRKAPKPSFTRPDWSTYRGHKRLVFFALAGYIPVGLLCWGAMRLFPGFETLVYGLFCLYMLLWTYIFLSYLSYPCPSCGTNLSGSQLYSKTCMKCHTPINPRAPQS